MGFCNNCGSQTMNGATFCTNCGASINPYATTNQGSDGLGIAAKIFLIISCVAQGVFLLPLAWCLPITISICKKLNSGEPISVGLKICALLFVNTIAGILLLCRSEN